MKEPLSVMMVDFQKNRTDKLIASVNEYQNLGEKIISEGNVIKRGNDEMTSTVAAYNREAIEHHNKKARKFINSVIKDFNEQHRRLLLACRQFRDANEKKLQQARELEVAIHTKPTEAASTSTYNAQSKDRLRLSSKGHMRSDTRLKTILEDPETQHGHDDNMDSAQPQKKRQWSTKLLHPRFWMKFIKKRKPE